MWSRTCCAEQVFSLQGNVKTLEGTRARPRRRFNYLNEQVKTHQPASSVDTKKKELVGQYKNGGRDWRPKGEPVQVEGHDFPGVLGKVAPYGIYDLAAGWVDVGTDHDTAAFAVESLRRWWNSVGVLGYPDANRLLVTAETPGAPTVAAPGPGRPNSAAT